jgi:hypothetical protein
MEVVCAFRPLDLPVCSSNLSFPHRLRHVVCQFLAVGHLLLHYGEKLGKNSCDSGDVTPVFIIIPAQGLTESVSEQNATNI